MQWEDNDAQLDPFNAKPSTAEVITFPPSRMLSCIEGRPNEFFPPIGATVVNSPTRFTAFAFG
jgi:hypothetical protein